MKKVQIICNPLFCNIIYPLTSLQYIYKETIKKREKRNILEREKNALNLSPIGYIK